MPKVIQNQQGGKIIFGAEDWVSSLAPNFTTSIGTQKGDKLVFMRSMNPFRNYGYVTPGYLPADVTNVSEVSEYCRKGLVNGNYSYIVTNGAKLQKLDITSTGSLTTTFHAITPPSGNTPIGNDCVIYTAKVGGTSASRYFYSYSSTTVWDVGTFDLNATFDDDFMSTAPATPLAAPYTTGGLGKPHPLIVGDDDVLYMGDRNFLHGYDGQNGNNGKFFPAVLTLPGGWIITSFSKTLTGLMIYAYLENSVDPSSSKFYLGQARAWQWDYNELDITRSYDLHDNYTSEGGNYGESGTPFIFTQGRPNDPSDITKTSKLQVFNGGGFKAVASFQENIPIRGGVDLIENAVYFNVGVAGGNSAVYCFGSPLTQKKAELNKVAELGGASGGMLGTFSSTVQWASSGATTTGGLQYMNTGTPGNYFAQSSVATGLAEPIFPIYKKGQVKNVKIRFASTNTAANSRGISIQLRDKNGTLSTVISQLNDIPDQDSMVIDRNVDTSNAPFLKFDGLRAVVIYDAGNGSTDAPILDDIEVEYELKNIK